MPKSLQRGDIVLTRFPYSDLSGASVRPALVVSQGPIGIDIVLAGISSVVRSPLPPTDALVDANHAEFPQTGLRTTSVIRIHKLVAVEDNVVVRRLGAVGPILQAEVDARLRLVLGL
jgi:mRNA interferase MazF